MDPLLAALGDTLRTADAGVKCALVHGSRTTGWAEPDSDTDLLVFSEQPESRGDVWLSTLLAPVAERFAARIDPMHIPVAVLDDIRAQREVIEGAWSLFRFAAVSGLPVIGSLESVLVPALVEELRRPIPPELAAQLYAFGQLAGGASYVSVIGESARSETRLRRKYPELARTPLEVAEASVVETEDARMAALKISQAVHTVTDGHKRRGDGDHIVRAAAEYVGVPAEPLVEIVALGGEIDATRLATWKRRLVRFLDRAADFLSSSASLPAEEWPALFLPYPPTRPLPSSAYLGRVRRLSAEEFLRLADIGVESAYEATWTTLDGGRLSSWNLTLRRDSAEIRAEVFACDEPRPAAAFAALFLGDASRARSSQALKHLLGLPALGIATLHVDSPESETPARRTARVLCPGISSSLRRSEESLHPSCDGKCLCPGLRKQCRRACWRVKRQSGRTHPQSAQGAQTSLASRAGSVGVTQPPLCGRACNANPALRVSGAQRRLMAAIGRQGGHGFWIGRCALAGVGVDANQLGRLEILPCMANIAQHACRTMGDSHSPVVTGAGVVFQRRSFGSRCATVAAARWARYRNSEGEGFEMDFSKLDQNEKWAAYGAIAAVVGTLLTAFGGFGGAGGLWLTLILALAMLAILFMPQLSAQTTLPGSKGSLMLIVGGIAAIGALLALLTLLAVLGAFANYPLWAIGLLLGIAGGLLMGWAGWQEFQAEGGKLQLGSPATASSADRGTSAAAAPPPPAAEPTTTAAPPPAAEPAPAPDRDEDPTYRP